MYLMQLILVRLADYLLFDLSVCDTSKGGQTTLDGCQNGLLKSPEDGWGGLQQAVQLFHDSSFW